MHRWVLRWLVSACFLLVAQTILPIRWGQVRRAKKTACHIGQATVDLKSNATQRKNRQYISSVLVLAVFYRVVSCYHWQWPMKRQEILEFEVCQKAVPWRNTCTLSWSCGALCSRLDLWSPRSFDGTFQLGQANDFYAYLNLEVDASEAEASLFTQISNKGVVSTCFNIFFFFWLNLNSLKKKSVEFTGAKTLSTTGATAWNPRLTSLGGKKSSPETGPQKGGTLTSTKMASRGWKKQKHHLENGRDWTGPFFVPVHGWWFSSVSVSKFCTFVLVYVHRTRATEIFQQLNKASILTRLSSWKPGVFERTARHMQFYLTNSSLHFWGFRTWYWHTNSDDLSSFWSECRCSDALLLMQMRTIMRWFQGGVQWLRQRARYDAVWHHRHFKGFGICIYLIRFPTAKTFLPRLHLQFLVFCILICFIFCKIVHRLALTSTRASML